MNEIIAEVSIFFNVIISIIGAAVVIFGSLQAAYGLLRAAAAKYTAQQRFKEYVEIKRVYVQKLIFALDFFIAADLLRLVAEPTLDEIVLIALIVVIRTVLNYSLAQEIRGPKK